MAKGQESKKIITDKILQTFENSFLYNNGKEIRIPIQEDNEMLQIKITLTCAKTNVEQGEDVAIPGVEVNTKTQKETISTKVNDLKPTEEEKKNVESLLSSLGMI